MELSISPPAADTPHSLASTSGGGAPSLTETAGEDIPLVLAPAPGADGPLRRTAGPGADALLALAGAHAHPALVPPAALARALAAATRLPAALVAGAYLECRLAPGDDAVDLVLRVEARGRGVLAGLDPFARLAPEQASHPVWSRIAALARCWADPGDPLSWLVGHLWLEFDLGAAGESPLPAPSLFIAPVPEATAEFGAGAWGALYRRAAGLVMESPLDATTDAALQRVLAARPLGTTVPYLGFMTARPGGAIRVYVREPRPADACAFLRRAGWAGPQADATEALVPGIPRTLWPAIGMMHVDVADGALLPRCGVEMTFARRPQLRGRIDEEAFVAALVDAGLCAPDKAAAMLAWPGAEQHVLPHELWRSWLVRRVNCVKLVHRAGAAPQAKAYLLTLPRPARRRRQALANTSLFPHFTPTTSS